jgi:hypothetical protein
LLHKILNKLAYIWKIKSKSSIIEPLTTRKSKWVTFTYFGPCVRTITKFFCNTELKVAFKINNTIKHHIRVRDKTTDVYNRSEVYQMECKECPLKYAGQTGRTFRTRYNEHIETQTNGESSKYAQHILDTTHNYDTMEEKIKILHVERKGQMLDTLENYYVYTITKEGLQMNETWTSTYNPIYCGVFRHARTVTQQ